MAKTVKPTIETGAMTLVLLVKNYKSQMIALLLKNGVTVPSGASDKQIAMLMVNLLKVSKTFFVDLNNFIQNPKVIQTLAGGMTQTADYFKMSGKGYMNSTGGEDGFTDTGESAPSGTPTKDKEGFWSNLNFGNLFSQTLGAFGQYDTNKANVAIANAYAQSQQVGSSVGSGVGASGNTGSGKKTPDTGMSTTTIVVLSLLGVAVIGTIIYFVAKPKE